MSRSNEPLVWAPFFAGAGLSAMLMPATIIITGFAVALGWISVPQFQKLLSHPLTRIYLFFLISLSLFHAVHRIRFILVDMGMKGIASLISFICYGTAIAGTVYTAWVALTI
ncbi:MAG: fumarate reductase subunit FrdD [Gemmataceae bacterium]